MPWSWSTAWIGDGTLPRSNSIVLTLSMMWLRVASYVSGIDNRQRICSRTSSGRARMRSERRSSLSITLPLAVSYAFTWLSYVVMVLTTSSNLAIFGM